MTATLLPGSRVTQPAAFEREIERAAAAMQSSGVAPGDAVALLLRNDFAFFVASLAARWIGAFATPINWHATPDEIGYILQDRSEEHTSELQSISRTSSAVLCVIRKLKR